jgi:hypothetical protein
MRPAETILVALLCATCQPGGAQAAPPATRPVVVELFTSEGCSSCPAADAFLTDLAKSRPDVLPLAFHITYWDHLGWPDPFALPAGTQRQRDYGRRLGSVYTPEMVVDGRIDVVGSDRAAAFEEIRASKGKPAAAPVEVRRDGGDLSITVGSGSGAGSVVLIGYDASHTTAVARGENGGRSLTESNIVRSIEPLGAWSGQPITLRRAAPAGERFVVLVQAPDGGFLGVGAPGG